MDQDRNWYREMEVLLCKIPKNAEQALGLDNEAGRVSRYMLEEVYIALNRHNNNKIIYYDFFFETVSLFHLGWSAVV